MSDQQLICAWCKTILREGTVPASHGICPTCSADTFPNAEEHMTVRMMLNKIGAFFRTLYRRVISAGRTATQIPGLNAPAAVESQVMRKRPRSAKMKKRFELRDLLHRTDGGGKHYASKRAFSNHRGSGKGKRSGRQ